LIVEPVDENGGGFGAHFQRPAPIIRPLPAFYGVLRRHYDQPRGQRPQRGCVERSVIAGRDALRDRQPEPLERIEEALRLADAGDRRQARLRRGQRRESLQ